MQISVGQQTLLNHLLLKNVRAKACQPIFTLMGGYEHAKKGFFISPAMFRFVLFWTAEDCFTGVLSQFGQVYIGHVQLHFAWPM